MTKDLLSHLVWLDGWLKLGESEIVGDDDDGDDDRCGGVEGRKGGQGCR